MALRSLLVALSLVATASTVAGSVKEIGRNLGQNIELKPGDTVVVP